MLAADRPQAHTKFEARWRASIHCGMQSLTSLDEPGKIESSLELFFGFLPSFFEAPGWTLWIWVLRICLKNRQVSGCLDFGRVCAGFGQQSVKRCNSKLSNDLRGAY